MNRSCENIGPRERGKRIRIGVASLAIAAALSTALMAFGAARGWRLLAAPAIWVGVLGLLQAQMRTCVVNAARGIRNMDAGDVAIADETDCAALQQRARAVYAWSFALTALALVVLLAF